MLTFTLENFRDAFPDIQPFWLPEWEEAGIDKEDIPLDVNVDQYYLLSDAGILHVIVIRDDGVAVGYLLYSVHYPIKFKTSLLGLVEAFWINPEYRNQGNGRRLIEVTEECFRQQGVKQAMASSSINQRVDHILSTCGWRHQENIYSKVLKEE